MTFYVYEVTVTLRGDAQASAEVTETIIEATQADAIHAQPGRLHVSGVIESASVLTAGETMRGILNRIALALMQANADVIAEGWTIREDDGSDIPVTSEAVNN